MLLCVVHADVGHAVHECALQREAGVVTRAEGGTLAFYGASSGYHFSFVGKPGRASAEQMLARLDRVREPRDLPAARTAEEPLDRTGHGKTELADSKLDIISAADMQEQRLPLRDTGTGASGFTGYVDSQSVEPGAHAGWPGTRFSRNCCTSRAVASSGPPLVITKASSKNWR